jgi:hypothetical protein
VERDVGLCTDGVVLCAIAKGRVHVALTVEAQLA